MLLMPVMSQGVRHPDALRVGIDIVQIETIAHAWRTFGQRYLQRVFSDGEIAYCTSAATHEVCVERLAARFAAKEAAIKAFDLAEVGVNLRDLEVVRSATGHCMLRLHGRARSVTGCHQDVAVSLTHEGDYAGAIVIAP